MNRNLPAAMLRLKYVVELGLVERDLTAPQFGQLRRVDVDADDVMAELGHARGVRRPKVAGADDRYAKGHEHLSREPRWLA